MPRRRLRQAAKNNAAIQSAKNRNPHCTRFRHPPVDELHLVENKPDKVAKKELTYKMLVVKTHSFFDSFQGFSRLAANPGLKRVHCSAPAAQGSRGAATVDSELLVEKNKRQVKGKSESRGVERLFRLVASPESKLRSNTAYASIR